MKLTLAIVTRMYNSFYYSAHSNNAQKLGHGALIRISE